MDHAINNLRIYFDVALDELTEEWKSGKYKKLTDCPSFKEASAYRSAMNVLIKACYLPEYVQDYLVAPLSKEMKFKSGQLK